MLHLAKHNIIIFGFFLLFLLAWISIKTTYLNHYTVLCDLLSTSVVLNPL